MKEIKLTRGFITQVDDEDYEWLNQWKWHVSKGNSNFYVVRTIRLPNGKRVRGAMHRLILGLTDSNIHGDHIDHNTMNNQRFNLRACTPEQNAKNRKSKPNSTSKYLGVHLTTSKKSYFTKRGFVTNIRTRWIAKIQSPEKEIHLGSFSNTPEGEIQAAKAYDEAAKKYHGEFANLNFKD